MLEIKNLHVSIGERKILDGLTLTVHDGEVAAIMGPNGTGKSTLSYVISGRDGYEVTQGEILLDGENLLGLEPWERAAKGRLSRLPISGRDPGRCDHDLPEGRAKCAKARARRGGIADARPMKRVNDAAAKLGVGKEMLRRPFNSGFSGGEKKRMEILQMALLQPSLGILDETDSGLDIDALRVVSEGVNALR